MARSWNLRLAPLSSSPGIKYDHRECDGCTRRKCTEPSGSRCKKSWKKCNPMASAEYRVDIQKAIAKPTEQHSTRNMIIGGPHHPKLM